LKKAVPAPVIASEAKRGGKQSRLSSAFLPSLRTAAEFYPDCHVAPLLAMAASAFFSSLLSSSSVHMLFAMNRLPLHHGML